jgi:hypothetical protein
MKAAILLAAISLSVSLVQGDASREKLVKENLKAVEDVTAVLKTVKDKDTAEIVVPRLEIVMKRLEATNDAIKKIPGNDAELVKANKAFAKELKAAREALAAELHRIHFKSPAWAWAQFNGKGAPKNVAVAQADIVNARLDIKGLDQAVTAYYLRKHFYPETLKVLCERDPIDNSPALLKGEEVLMDPWGNAYIYEPQTLNPKTDKPLIWTAGPPGSSIRISNWD